MFFGFLFAHDQKKDRKRVVDPIVWRVCGSLGDRDGDRQDDLKAEQINIRLVAGLLSRETVGSRQINNLETPLLMDLEKSCAFSTITDGEPRMMTGNNEGAGNEAGTLGGCVNQREQRTATFCNFRQKSF